MKKGPKGGPRPVFFTCSAIVDGDLVQDSIYNPNDVNPDHFFQNDAIAIFEKKYGVKPHPSKVKGPCYDKKRAIVKIQIENPQVDWDSVKVTSSRRGAINQGWKGMAFDLSKPEQKELVLFVALEPLEGKKKNIPRPEVVRRDVVQFLD